MPFFAAGQDASMNSQDIVTAPRHIAIVCFGLEATHLRKQPWHSVWGIAHGLQQNGFSVSLITNAQTPPTSDVLRIIAIDRLYDNNAPSPQLLHELQSLTPDRIVVVGGTQELLRAQRFALNAPVSLLLANQRFSWQELRRLTLMEWLTEWRMLKIPLIQSVLPAFVLRHGLSTTGIAHLVYLSEAAQKRHASDGLPPGSVIRPRVCSEFLPVPLQQKSVTVARANTIFFYFGSPLLLRGVKDVITAFLQACHDGMIARLALYIRVDDDYTTQRAAEIRHHIDTHAGIYKNRIAYHDEKLSTQALSDELAKADIFVLPFKVTVSDVPLVVIEAAMRGKPVITFDTPGISEWRQTFSNIIVSVPPLLARVMQQTATKSQAITLLNPAVWADWKTAMAPLTQALHNPLDCNALDNFRMICLIGVDGCGKTTLLARLSEQLGLSLRKHGYIWSRFRNYLSKPFLCLMRMTGHNRKVVINGVRIGLHEFAGNVLISSIFLLLQKCDMWLDIQLRYRPRLAHGLVLGDRCPLDTLIDLAIDTGRDEQIFDTYGKNLFAALPQPALIVMITRDASTSLANRPDIAADSHYSRRVALYQKMANAFGIPVLRNNGSIEQSLEQLCQIARNHYP